MEVKLLHHSPLEVIVTGIRKCYESQEKSDSVYETINDYSSMQNMVKSMQSFYNPTFKLGDKDRALINRVIESGHESTLEHCVFTFDVNGFSRAVLQEFARHRIGTSPSVKSTRYTLKELKEEDSFCYIDKTYDLPYFDWNNAERYIVLTGNDDIDRCSMIALEGVRRMLKAGYPNDKVKYCLPECYKTSMQVTFNVRSLRHFLELRTDPRALWEIREMAYAFYDAIPEPYKFLFDNVVHKEEK